MTLEAWPTPNWPKNVPREISGFEKPVYTVIDEAAEKYPNNVFTIFNNATRTFKQVKEVADKVANYLASIGIKKGDRVAIFLPNLPHYPSIYFGILKTGATCVTCNPMYTKEELNFQLRDAGAKAVFVMDHPTLYPTAVDAIKGTDVETVIICSVKSYLPGVTAFLGGLLGKIPKADQHEPGHLLFDDIIATAKPEPPKIDVDPDNDAALIIYTGGTTGVPKGAVLKHSGFIHNLEAASKWFIIEHAEGDEPEPIRHGGFHTFLGVLPWYHIFGMTCVMLLACYTGSKLICVPDPRAGDPPFTDVLKVVQKHKATLMVAVPTIYVAFTNHSKLDDYDLTSMMGCFSGGAPLPVEACKKFEEKTGAIIFEGYGLSETSPIACINPSDINTRKIGSIGFPIQSTDIKILDIDEGTKELAQGEDGEIAIHGPQVMLGYWKKPDATDQVFREIDGKRYFLTGDVGHIDSEGYIVITDRKKDLIIVGGFNCYPREVEEVLYGHPKVENAAVVGVPDEHSGEKVKAFVQLKKDVEATEEEILEYCKERLAGYKRPRSVEFRNELPISVVGKVIRRVLRDEEVKKS